MLCIGLAVGGFGLGLGVSPLLLDKEMRSLMNIKSHIQKEYYYDVSDEEFYGVIFDAINEDLLDKYSAYMTQEEYEAKQAQAAGKRNDTGLTYTVDALGTEEKVYVNLVRGNSPAEQSGFRRGDKIVAVGDSEEALTSLESYEQLTDYVDSKATGAPFYLQIERAGVTQTMCVSNEYFVENYVYYRDGDGSFAFTGESAQTLTETHDPLVGLTEDTAYIRLTKFNGGVVGQFAQAMNLFRERGKKHLVLDLRDNGGGYIHLLSEIAAYFCKSATSSKPTIAVANYADGKKEYFRASGNVYEEYFGADSQLYVLADRHTASASESLIGCMVDYGSLPMDNICLVEEDGVAKTYGKGIMQTTYEFWLWKTDAIKLTTAQVHWPVSNKCIHGVGVTTDDGCKKAAYTLDKDGEVYGALSALGIV